MKGGKKCHACFSQKREYFNYNTDRKLNTLSN